MTPTDDAATVAPVGRRAVGHRRHADAHAGVGVRAFVAAMEEVTGRRWEPQRLDFGGRTDPDIAALLLARSASTTRLVPAVLAAFIRGYAALDADLQASVRVMPGVAAALDALGVPARARRRHRQHRGRWPVRS